MKTLLLLALLAVGCDRRAAVAAPSTRPTVASTVPAGTDLVVGMGAGDRLVAVSTYDAGRADVGRLPKAGNYDTVDWEQISRVRPTVLLTAIAPDRQPAGFTQRAAEFGVRPVDVRIEKLDDLGRAVDKIGAAIGATPLATATHERIDRKLNAVRASVAGRPLVPTLIVLDPAATAVAGPGEYLDDVLTLAGGSNVAAGLGRPWPNVDREALRSFRPAVVIVLVPDGRPQSVAAARATWNQLPHDRLYVLTDPYALQPGFHLPELAERFALCLHPTPTSQP